MIDLTLEDSISPAKRARSSSGITRASTPTPDGRTQEWREDFQIGGRPAKLSKFPARTVREMEVRIRWIMENEHVGNVEARYKAVFSCEFVNSTYFRHQAAWIWLRDNGRLMATDPMDLWKNLAHEANEAIRKTKEGSTRLGRNQVIHID